MPTKKKTKPQRLEMRFTFRASPSALRYIPPGDLRAYAKGLEREAVEIVERDPSTTSLSRLYEDPLYGQLEASFTFTRSSTRLIRCTIVLGLPR